MPLSVHQDAPKNAVLQQHTKCMSGVELFKSNDKDHPLTCGIAVMEKGQSIKWTYPGAEFAFILEGEMEARDSSDPDKVIHLKAGDICRADKGDVLTMSTPTRCKSFFVSQLPDDINLETIMEIKDL
ncbi:hypothetical protein FRC03_011110 [Tulasnella sp. 419]|nr:hypothetical protein FRC02_011178 [Tulasnella sp. 418]KAG8955532.1 hypothetical protein FRC03_011110 [Tulasnella sp. 419]